jgi:hypothetical protein
MTDGQRSAAEECCDYFDSIARSQPREKVIAGLGEIIAHHHAAMREALVEARKFLVDVTDSERLPTIMSFPVIDRIDAALALAAPAGEEKGVGDE